MHSKFTVFPFGMILFFFGLLSLFSVEPAAGSAWLKTGVPGGTVPPPTSTLHLPAIYQAWTALPPQPVRSYGAVPIDADLPECPHGAPPDVDLTIRSWAPHRGYLGLVGYGGETDPDAPQIAGVFAPVRVPAMLAVSQVYDWNWACEPPAGCRGAPITLPYDVTLLTLSTTPGEPLISRPRRRHLRWRLSGHCALRRGTRITLAYTRDDSPACGYVVHMEDVAVNPGLLDLYQKLDGTGRKWLPGPAQRRDTWRRRRGLA